MTIQEIRAATSAALQTRGNTLLECAFHRLSDVMQMEVEREIQEIGDELFKRKNRAAMVRNFCMGLNRAS